MAKAKKRSKGSNFSAIILAVFLLVAISAGYFFLTQYEDLAIAFPERNHAEKVDGNVRQTYSVVIWNAYFTPIDLHLEMPQVWIDQGALLDTRVRDVRIPAFSKQKIDLTLQVPLDLIDTGDLPIELVKSIERGTQNPIVRSLKLNVSSLADEAPSK